MAAPKLTIERAVILSAYTGYLFCDLEHLAKYASEKLQRNIDKETLTKVVGMEEKLHDASTEDVKQLFV